MNKHDGFWNFTIGQRKGLGIGYKEPLYVVNINPDKNEVKVGTIKETKRKSFVVNNINWLSKEDISEAYVKIRYNHPKKRAKITTIDKDKLRVDFIEEESAITPGQAAVFYDSEYVIGGGWIERIV